MRVAVVGGRLQGIEACYLAHRAGWEVVLIDRNPSVPARGLCDDFLCRDVSGRSAEIEAALREVDLIIPTMEDPEGLRSLTEKAVAWNLPLAFDPDAYAVTSSKKRSDDLFHRLGLPAPRPWPDCGLPVVVKPAESSGSKGVKKIVYEEALSDFLRENRQGRESWIIQEYLPGPSYSLEVMGLDDRCITLQTTALQMDATFDCKRVLAPAHLRASLDEELRETAACLARALRLKGVMDVEVVDHGGHMKVLEIDARLPSQTPTAVERSTGRNMLELLGEIFLHGRLEEARTTGPERGVVYEHIRVWKNCLEVSGEHVMAGAGPLRMEEGFFGADAALTDFAGPARPWVATLIVSDTDRERAWEKRSHVIRSIMEACGLSDCRDPFPA